MDGMIQTSVTCSYCVRLTMLWFILKKRHVKYFDWLVWLSTGLGWLVIKSQNLKSPNFACYTDHQQYSLLFQHRPRSPKNYHRRMVDFMKNNILVGLLFLLHVHPVHINDFQKYQKILKLISIRTIFFLFILVNAGCLVVLCCWSVLRW